MQRFIAERYTSALVDYCEGLKDFPNRANLHNAILPGLRLTNYKGRVVIAFAVEVEVVSIIGLYYGGQDHETALKSEVRDPKVPYGLRPFQSRGGIVTNERIEQLREGGVY